MKNQIFDFIKRGWTQKITRKQRNSTKRIELKWENVNISKSYVKFKYVLGMI